MHRIRQLSAVQMRFVMVDGINSLDDTVQYDSTELERGHGKQDLKQHTEAVKKVHSKVERTVNNYVWLCWKARERALDSR